MSDKELVLGAAHGRWPDIIAALGGVRYDVLDGKHHPCPKCGGTDRFRMIDRDRGAVLCNQCFREHNGDGLSALQWLCSWDFMETVRRVADYLHVEVSSNKKNGSRNEFVWQPWNEILVASWTRHKPGVSPDAVAAFGGRLGTWKGSTLVVAVPITSPGGQERGWVFWDATGQPLRTKTGAKKMLCSFKAQNGWIGAWALDRLVNAKVIYRTEGPTDAMALWKAIPAELRETHLVLSNPFGAGQKGRADPGLLSIFKGKNVVVIGDNDANGVGQKGAEAWAGDLAAIAAEVRVWIPPDTKDLREWFNAGHVYDELRTVTEIMPSVKPSLPEPGTYLPEEDDDPTRLACLYARQYPRSIATSHGETYVWRESCWCQASPYSTQASVHRFVNDEFIRILKEEMILAASSDKPPPKKHRTTPKLVNSVVEALRSYVCVDESISFGSLLSRGEDCFGPVTEGAPKPWVAMQNGIVDLADAGAPRLLEHNPDFWSTTCLPYRYDPKAGPDERPKFEAFLDRNLQSDDDKITTMQEWAGYCLLPHLQYHRFLIVDGEGANGKSVFCAILEALLGETNVSHVPLEGFGQRFDLVHTVGKLANVITEVGELDKIAEGVLKQFVAGEAMQFDRKHKAPIVTRPTAKLILATNNRPRFGDRSDGIWRRMLGIPFEIQIPVQDRVIGMDRPAWWYASGEMPAIFNWALAGLRRLLAQSRFSETSLQQRYRDDYQDETNPAREFLRENYGANPDGWVPVSTVYADYRRWCTDNGYRPLADKSFGKEVRRFFKSVVRARAGSRDSRSWIYRGISSTKGTWTDPLASTN